MRKTWRYGVLAGLLTVSAVGGTGVQAKDYPDKVVQIIEEFGCRKHAGRGPAVCCR